MCQTGCFLSYLVLGPVESSKTPFEHLRISGQKRQQGQNETFFSTIFKARSMSMPWLQGTAGLARQSPALPLRDTSTRWRRRYRKASAITRMASWVSADVYWKATRKPSDSWPHANPRAALRRGRYPCRTADGKKKNQTKSPRSDGQCVKASSIPGQMWEMI